MGPSTAHSGASSIPRWLKILPVLLVPLAAAPALPTPGNLVAETTAPPFVPETPPPAPLDPNQPPAEVDRVPIAVLVDLSSGQVLYQKQPDRRFVPASITKVMTLYTAFDLMRHKQLLPNQRFTMSARAFKSWHRVGSTMFLDQTMSPTVDDLLLGIANISANDACVVLAEGAAGSVDNWVTLMNAEARGLGMKDSHFGTPNGWMDDGETYVSAHDLVTLASAIFARFPADYHAYIGHETLTWNGITQHNHDPILGKLNGADGIKTGFTNQAGYGFLGSAERNGRRLVLVVAGADRPSDRAAAAKALVEWGFDAFTSKRIFAPGAVVGQAKVQGGAARKVDLVVPQGLAASMANTASAPLDLRIVYDGPLEAPVEKGAIVASLEIHQGGLPPRRVPLIAANGVGKASPFERLRNGLMGLLPW